MHAVARAGCNPQALKKLNLEKLVHSGILKRLNANHISHMTTLVAIDELKLISDKYEVGIEAGVMKRKKAAWDAFKISLTVPNDKLLITT